MIGGPREHILAIVFAILSVSSVLVWATIIVTQAIEEVADVILEEFDEEEG